MPRIIDPADFQLLTHHVSRHVPRSGGTGRPWYTTRNVPVRLGVIHTAENLPDWDGTDTGAEQVAAYGATTERASWHDTIDSDSWVRMLPHQYTAFHVRGFNSPSVGLEIATQAHRWVGSPIPWRYATLDRTAAWVADVHRRHDIPIRRLSRPQVDAGMSGFVGHNVLDPTRRTDPGEAFPWDYVMETARTLADIPGPPPTYADRGQWAEWAVAAIERVIETGIMRGDPADGHMRFHPDRTVTRQELAVALHRTIEHLRSNP